MSKHTPGPWHVLTDVDRIRDSARIFAGSKFIGMVGNSDDTHEQTYSNAELVAAAPELLEALEDLMYWLNICSTPTLQSIEIANQVIAKAKGE